MNDKEVKLMYVEDDATLAFITQDSLKANGYDVDHFEDGVAALESFEKLYYDLCILDVMLPKMDGFELAERIRRVNKDIPIIFLTAKSMKEDRIAGLTIGADDYITKPFSIEELILKIEVFLKRKYITDSQAHSYTFGKFTFDHDNLKLSYDNKEESLTQKEGDLLQLLLESRGNIIRREDILKKLWGENDYFLGRSMDVFISRLRKYMKSDASIAIENIHGVGFRFLENQ